MPGPTDIRIEAATTSVTGRFVISGEHFQLVADGSVGTGGPGIAAGAMHLLASSLATCALNIMRGAVETELVSPRIASVSAHLKRAEAQEKFTLALEAKVQNIDEHQAAQLKQLYLDHCSIYAALKNALDIHFTVRPA